MHEDSRGYFYESWNQYKFNKLVGKEINFVQDNQSMSFINVIRGLHYQMDPKPQDKLVKVIRKSLRRYCRFEEKFKNIWRMGWS